MPKITARITEVSHLSKDELKEKIIKELAARYRKEIDNNINEEEEGVFTLEVMALNLAHATKDGKMPNQADASVCRRVRQRG